MKLGQRGDRDHLDIGNQRSFGRIYGWYKNLPETLSTSDRCHWKHTAHMPDAAIQREFPHKQRVFNTGRGDLTRSDQNPHRNG